MSKSCLGKPKDAHRPTIRIDCSEGSIEHYVQRSTTVIYGSTISDLQ